MHNIYFVNYSSFFFIIITKSSGYTLNQSFLFINSDIISIVVLIYRNLSYPLSNSLFHTEVIFLPHPSALQILYFLLFSFPVTMWYPVIHLRCMTSAYHIHLRSNQNHMKIHLHLYSYSCYYILKHFSSLFVFTLCHSVCNKCKLS